MAEWLILQLPGAGDTSCNWMLVDAGGHALSAPETGPLAEALAVASGRRVGLIAPSGDVLLTEVELPPKSGVRPQQLVAYALEEQLAADIETLHFAVGPRDEASGRTAVAVVTRALMSRWLEEFAAAGIVPAAVSAGASLLPDNPGHTVVMLDRDTLSLRRAGRQAMALPADNIVAGLEASLGNELIADDLIFYASPQDWQLRSAEVEALRPHCASLKVQLLNAGPLPLLSPQLVAGGFINLLSGEFAPQAATSGGWRRWRLAAMLAAALFAVHVGGLSLQLWQQSRSEHALDAEIAAIARGALPGDSGTGAVRSRVERRLLAAQSEVRCGRIHACALGARPGTERRSCFLAGAQLSRGRPGSETQGRRCRESRTHQPGIAQQRLAGGADLGGAAASGYEGRIQLRRGGAAPKAH